MIFNFSFSYNSLPFLLWELFCILIVKLNQVLDQNFKCHLPPQRPCQMFNLSSWSIRWCCSCKWEIPRVNWVLRAKLAANAQILPLAPNFKNKRDRIGCLLHTLNKKTTRKLPEFSEEILTNDIGRICGDTFRGIVVFCEAQAQFGKSSEIPKMLRSTFSIVLL